MNATLVAQIFNLIFLATIIGLIFFVVKITMDKVKIMDKRLKALEKRVKQYPPSKVKVSRSQRN